MGTFMCEVAMHTASNRLMRKFTSGYLLGQFSNTTVVLRGTTPASEHTWSMGCPITARRM